MYCFGGFTLDPARAALLRNGEEIPLRQRTFDVLIHLVRNSGRLVSKQELFEALWRDVAVTDDSLVQCLVEIRKALGDEQHRVRTVRGRGYLFEADATDRSEATARAFPSRRIALLLGGIAILAVGAWLYGRSRAIPHMSTLAVLPFVQTAVGDPSELGGGLQDEVVSALGQIDPERLRVLSRRSTASYVSTGKSAAVIGQELGADYLVEGVIHEQGAGWQIRFAVVHARDQIQVWTGTFDRDRSSLLSLQTELGRAVAQQIRLTLSARQDQALIRRQALSPEAYQVLPPRARAVGEAESGRSVRGDWRV